MMVTVYRGRFGICTSIKMSDLVVGDIIDVD